MGTILGSLMAIGVAAISVIAGLFLPAAGAMTALVVMYFALAVVWALDRKTRPPQYVPFCSLLSTEEMDAYQRYHTFILLPGTGQMLSAFLNGLRITGIIWGVICLWQGRLAFGVPFVAYSVLAAGLVLRLNPLPYMISAAHKGRAAAIAELGLIESIQAKREPCARMPGLIF